MPVRCAEKRDAEREKQRQEAQDRADSERRARALFEEAKNGFVGIASVIAADFPEEKSPLSLKSDGRFFVVGWGRAFDFKTRVCAARVPFVRRADPGRDRNLRGDQNPRQRRSWRDVDGTRSGVVLAG